MRISPERLSAEAEATGFQPELLEKTFHLLGCSRPSTATRSSGKASPQGRHCSEPVRIRCAQTLGGYRSQLCLR